MALTLAILPGRQATSVVAGQSVSYVASVTNSGSSSVTLQALAAFTDTSQGGGMQLSSGFNLVNLLTSFG